TYAIQEYHTLFQQSSQLKSKLDDTQFRVDDLSSDLARKQNALAEKRQQFDAQTEKKQRLEYELVQAKAAMQSAEQRQQYARQQLEQIAEQIAAFESDRADAEIKLAEMSQSLSTETQTLERLTQQLEQQRVHIE